MGHDVECIIMASAMVSVFRIMSTAVLPGICVGKVLKQNLHYDI